MFEIATTYEESTNTVPVKMKQTQLNTGWLEGIIALTRAAFCRHGELVEATLKR